MTVLHHHEFGDPAGAPLLAVHGITAHGRRFRRLAEEAWPERRTIAVDLRGHGRSTSDGPWSIVQHVTDLVETIDALALANVDLIGHSYGGAIGLHLLARVPERIGRFVMLDPVIGAAGPVGSANALNAIADNGYATIEEATVARNAGLGDTINPAVIEDIAEHLVESDDGRFRFRYHKPAVVTGWGELCTPCPSSVVKRPTLLVVCDKAGLVPAATELALAQLFAGSFESAHLDCGHMLYWEDFDGTAAIVVPFLRRT